MDGGTNGMLVVVTGQAMLHMEQGGLGYQLEFQGRC